MKKILNISILCIFVLTLYSLTVAQTPSNDEAKAEAAFKTANQLMEQKKYEEAYGKYAEVLKVFPEEPSSLF